MQPTRGKAFIAAIEERGYAIARGDRRDFVVLDHASKTGTAWARAPLGVRGRRGQSQVRGCRLRQFANRRRRQDASARTGSRPSCRVHSRRCREAPSSTFRSSTMTANSGAATNRSGEKQWHEGCGIPPRPHRDLAAERKRPGVQGVRPRAAESRKRRISGPFAVVDPDGKAHNLARNLERVSLAAFREGMADIDRDSLPDVAEARRLQRERMAGRAVHVSTRSSITTLPPTNVLTRRRSSRPPSRMTLSNASTTPSMWPGTRRPNRLAKPSPKFTTGMLLTANGSPALPRLA